jgi:hypothetical protein
MWEQCLRADGRQTVDIRLAENPGEVAKYVTKPSAHLKFDGDGVAIPSGLKPFTTRSIAGG